VLALLVSSMTLSSCVVVKPIILVYGDSLTAESVDYIVYLMGDGYDVRVDATGGTALCDYRDRMVREAAELRPKLLISAFSGNSGTPCMEDRPTSVPVTEKYREDATFLAERLAGLRIPIAFVLPPPTLRQDESGAASIDERVPLDGRYQTWAETGIDTESPNAAGPATATNRTQSIRSWQVGEIPDGFRSQTHELDGIYRGIAAEWRARGAAVGVIDGFSPFATAQGSWTKVQPCGPGEAGTALCRNGLVDIRSEDLGHFCPTTVSYQGLVPTCDTYSPGALRWASQMAAYVRFMDRETIGFFDEVSGGVASVKIDGWAIDPSLDLAPTHVHVYVDDATTALLANRSRPDVGRAFPVAGSDHGFSATIPAAPGIRSVCAYAINLAGPGSNVLLGCRTVAVRAW